MNTRTFGLAPSNTTLTITYRYGGAVEHNVRSNSITFPKNITFTIQEDGLTASLVQTSKDSLGFTNSTGASGGASQETLTEIKQNAAAYFNAQNRAVTKADYITRVYSLRTRYLKELNCLYLQLFNILEMLGITREKDRSILVGGRGDEGIDDIRTISPPKPGRDFDDGGGEVKYSENREKRSYRGWGMPVFIVDSAELSCQHRFLSSYGSTVSLELAFLHFHNKDDNEQDWG